MLPKIHAEITKRALNGLISTTALQKIIAANRYQDRIAGQIGHDEYHFDNNAFEKSIAYMEEQRGLVISSLQKNDALSAWSAFGRLAHTAQDFYAHSNYIDLWLSCRPHGTVPTPSEIDPVDAALIDTPLLRSGKLYYPLEILGFVKILKPLVLRILPRDSHAWVNLDDPGQGPAFDFAYQAAIKRTRIEFDKTIEGLSQDLYRSFVDRQMNGYGILE